QEKIEDFTEDMNRLLHSARTRAEGWLSQRQEISKTLIGIRDTASNLLEQFGSATNRAAGAAARAVAPRRRRRRGRAAAGVGKVSAAPARKPSGRRKRTMSPEARERIAAAQRARWARIRAGQKKS